MSREWKPTEGSFKSESLKRLKKLLSNYFEPTRIHVHKLSCHEMQGIPDQIIIVEPFHAYLEYKRSKHEHHQPNQDYYIDLYNRKYGTYASFIYPENEQLIFAQVLEYFLKKEKQQNEHELERPS